MYTYQDLLKVGDGEVNKGKFCRNAVESFMCSKEYQNAKEGEAYYNKHNLTIEKFQKCLFTLSGNKIADVWSANYKLKTLFFRRLVIQQVQYVLGNGLTLDDVNNKAKLGKDFDFQLQNLAKRSMASGVGFGFWNYDHLEVFGFADTSAQPGFCPLYSEKTGKLEAGIRFWFRDVAEHVMFRATLYEADGYTEYQMMDDEEPVVIEPKRAYKRIVKQSAIGIEEVIDENYGTLPIIPMYANDSHESELVGIRESIDCYDFIKSGLGNAIDDNSDVFWLINNTGGMDDIDLAKFIQRMKTVHAASVDGDDGVSASANTIEVPHEARRVMLELLRSDIYEDFQALDVKSLSAAAKTTQEIQAAYQSQDNKCADFEYFIIDFVDKILELAGINDNPTLNWNRVVNQGEQTDMILSCAEYLPEEIIIKHLPFLTPEEADIAIKQYRTQEYEQFNAEEDAEEESEDEETDDESIDLNGMFDEIIGELESLVRG